MDDCTIFVLGQLLSSAFSAKSYKQCHFHDCFVAVVVVVVATAVVVVFL